MDHTTHSVNPLHEISALYCSKLMQGWLYLLFLVPCMKYEVLVSFPYETPWFRNRRSGLINGSPCIWVCEIVDCTSVPGHTLVLKGKYYNQTLYYIFGWLRNMVASV